MKAERKVGRTTQKHMAELFQTSKQNIGQHLKNIFEEGELNENSVVKKFFTTAADGKKYQTSFYNLAAIISIRINRKGNTRKAVLSRPPPDFWGFVKNYD